jgi:hypothetical protein
MRLGSSAVRRREGQGHQKALQRILNDYFFEQLGAVPVRNEAPFPILHRASNGSRDTHGTSVGNFPSDLQLQAWPKSPASIKSSR